MRLRHLTLALIALTGVWLAMLKAVRGPLTHT